MTLRPIPSSFALIALLSAFTWTTTHKTPDPPPRDHHDMAFDAARGRIVLYGGGSMSSAGGSYLGDTWELGSSGWVSITPRSGTPGLRASNATVYDPVTRRTLLLGGFAPAGQRGTPLGDMWAWDGSSWQEVAGGGPAAASARYSVHAAFDPIRNRLVVFGGCADSGADPADTWEWDGQRWTRFDVTGPPPRCRGAMTFDPVRKTVVLVGGSSGADVYSDFWEWNGKAWKEVPQQTPPPGRGGSRIAFDAKRRVLVLYGGAAGAPDFSFLDDTWEFDDHAWHKLEVSGPGRRALFAMAWDPGRGEVLLYGGSAGKPSYHSLGDLWAWNGSRWSLVGTP